MPAWVHPVPLWQGREPVVTSGYGQRTRSFHYGVDILYPWKPGDPTTYPWAQPPSVPEGRGWTMPDGIPTLAASTGTVIRSGLIGTGNWVGIDHGDGTRTYYMHLAQRFVNIGDVVMTGQPIGFIGREPGDHELNHLHFQLHKDGVAVDPEPELASWTIIANPLERLERASLRTGPSPLRLFLLGVALAGAAGFSWYAVREARKVSRLRMAGARSRRRALREGS